MKNLIKELFEEILSAQERYINYKISVNMLNGDIQRAKEAMLSEDEDEIKFMIKKLKNY